MNLKEFKTELTQLIEKLNEDQGVILTDINLDVIIHDSAAFSKTPIRTNISLKFE